MATGCRLRSGRGTPPLAPQSLATCWLTTRCEQTNRYKHAIYPTNMQSIQSFALVSTCTTGTWSQLLGCLHPPWRCASLGTGLPSPAACTWRNPVAVDLLRSACAASGRMGRGSRYAWCQWWEQLRGRVELVVVRRAKAAAASPTTSQNHQECPALPVDQLLRRVVHCSRDGAEGRAGYNNQSVETV